MYRRRAVQREHVRQVTGGAAVMLKTWLLLSLLKLRPEQQLLNASASLLGKACVSQGSGSRSGCGLCDTRAAVFCALLLPQYRQ